MRNSLWQDTVTLPEFESLKGEIKTDVLIIGGGLCGILCAYFLKNAGIDYVLVEGNKIASGTTKNTTAKITSQHGLIYSKLISQYGKEKTKMYLEANERAILEYKKLSNTIDCDFEEKSSFVYSLSDRQKIEDEVLALNSISFPAKFEEETELPFSIAGAVRFLNQAQFNPLKFISQISKDLNIYENTFIREITPTGAFSENFKIKAKKIIVTTHFPFINKHGSYFLKLYQHRSYLSAFENAEKIDGMYVDESKTGMSFRSYKNFLLIGGGGHRTGHNGGNWQEIEAFAKKYYPDSEPKYQWATQDCMSLDGIPYIGQYSKNTPNLFVASGFNKWGMTSSMVSAMLILDMVQEKNNDYLEVFSPSRSILKPQLFINGFETTKNLLTPTVKRCPHLGCALKWNEHEHSWDCPCHGSRFEENGKLIDNPATGNADVNNKSN